LVSSGHPSSFCKLALLAALLSIVFAFLAGAVLAVFFGFIALSYPLILAENHDF
jgi:hypothetical protein